MQEKKVCIECRSNPVRQTGKHLCYVCFEVALRDLLRGEDDDGNEEVDEGRARGNVCGAYPMDGVEYKRL